VGLIGSGHIGITVAQLAIEAGHRVVLSNSRGAETLTDRVAQLGPRAAAATSEQAAAAGDIIVVAVPVKAFPDLPAAPLAARGIHGAAEWPTTPPVSAFGPDDPFTAVGTHRAIPRGAIPRGGEHPPRCARCAVRVVRHAVGTVRASVDGCANGFSGLPR
jgi:hypothetical protein